MTASYIIIYSAAARREAGLGMAAGSGEAKAMRLAIADPGGALAAGKWGRR